MPAELKPLINPQQTVSGLHLTTHRASSEAAMEYDKLMEYPERAPAPPVFAARLNGLLKKLAVAEGAVQECVTAREALVGALEKLLDTNKRELENEQARLADLSAKRVRVDDKKNEVEHLIIANLASADKNEVAGVASNSPEVEALTPPPMSPEPSGEISNANHQSTSAANSSNQAQGAPGIEMLSNLASTYEAVPISVNGSNKRRRIDTEDEFPDLGNDGIDDDVAEMLRKDSHAS
jgi:regulator of Ty1 transposition protein 103